MGAASAPGFQTRQVAADQKRLQQQDAESEDAGEGGDRVDRAAIGVERAAGRKSQRQADRSDDRRPDEDGPAPPASAPIP